MANENTTLPQKPDSQKKVSADWGFGCLGLIAFAVLWPMAVMIFIFQSNIEAPAARTILTLLAFVPFIIVFIRWAFKRTRKATPRFKLLTL